MEALNNSKRHIVFLSLSPAFGGRENRLIQWLRLVDYSKVRATIVSRKDVYSDLLEKYRIPVKVNITGLDLRFSFENLCKWFRFLKGLNADEILFMQGWFFEVPLFLVFIGFIVTNGLVCISEHLAAPPPPVKSSRFHFKVIPGLGIWWYKQVLSRRCRYFLSKKVIAVSNSVRQRLIDWGCPECKIKVISHGVDFELFRPSEEERFNFREIAHIPQDAIVLVSTARLVREKGPGRLVKAFNFLGDKHANLWLIFAGEGTLKEELRESVKYKNRVLFLGQVSQEDVARVLKASDIYVLPSDNEGAPTALIEAMATGLMCIATNVPGPRDIIRHGTNGFLVDPSEKPILSMIEELLALDLIKKKQIAETAISSVKENYKIVPAIANVLSILDIPSTCSRDCLSELR